MRLTSISKASVLLAIAAFGLLGSLEANSQAASIVMGDQPAGSANYVPICAESDFSLCVTIKGGVSPAPTALTTTNKSIALTLGGTAQTIMAANTSRRDCTIQNDATETELLYVNVAATAVTTGTSFTLTPGQAFGCSVLGGVTKELISVIAATTGHKIIAKEYQ